MWGSGRRARTRIASMTLVATGLIPSAPVADAGGGSFRLPDLFGSLASIPAAPRQHMRNRHRRLLLASIVSLSAVVGAAEHALAVTFSEFPIPTANSSPNDITAGPDGALWFTEGTANKIGRVSTSGVITETTLPTPDSGPANITPGTDGALWFTEFFNNKIGRITTSGTITETTIPTAMSFPQGIIKGPDDALWFVESGADPSGVNHIGRITTSGTITEFVIPSAAMGGSNPQGITTGPDGALWFTEFDTNQIGRISTAGVIAEFV